ncbi:conserved hypothetical protein [Mesorhizobium prunaredense]|uniref:Uncharacterized protein n=1 Tax=Mesorhizobium prunaredense TaxID=1631249 RepID=A0A1R3UYS5_9HYPH|nr:conserved hypothetical protein [Mesorhizobium prunaredense]
MSAHPSARPPLLAIRLSRIKVSAQNSPEAAPAAVEAARLRRIVNIPASYQTVARRVLVREGASRWRQVRIARHCRF